MENNQPQLEQPLETVIGSLREEYIKHSPELTTQEAPKVGKQLRPGKSKNHWLILLTALVIISGVAAAVLLLNLGQSQNSTRNTEPNTVVGGETLDDWADYIDPTLPAATAVILPESDGESIPIEPTPALPEVTPWPTPPITPP